MLGYFFVYSKGSVLQSTIMQMDEVAAEIFKDDIQGRLLQVAGDFGTLIGHEEEREISVVLVTDVKVSTFMKQSFMSGGTESETIVVETPLSEKIILGKVITKGKSFEMVRRSVPAKFGLKTKIFWNDR